MTPAAATTERIRRRKARPRRSKAAPKIPELVTYCGLCADHKGVWCPDCCGFAGCETCGFTYKVPCPGCSDGMLEPIKW